MADASIPGVKLSKLVNSLPAWQGNSTLEQVISGVVGDSRKVKPGFIFVAQEGNSTDGHRFIPDAISRGAVAVFGTKDLPGVSVPYFIISDSREALALLAAAFYDHPGRKLLVIGVTGTDGKTTTTNLIYEILKAAGLKVGMISTVNAIIGDENLDTGFHVTTPEAPDVQQYLTKMVQAGLTHVVLETTSHALAQHRVTGCEFDIAVITNITHEHLDFHETFHAYRAAKARLLILVNQTVKKNFSAPRAVVLNLDDQSYTYLSEIVKVSQISYSLNAEANLTAREIEYLPEGTRFKVVGRGLDGKDFEFPVETQLVGEFNVSNCLAAIAVGKCSLDLSPLAIQNGIYNLAGIPGRMEKIFLPELDAGQQKIIVIVDFAHTPNALNRSLETARRLTQGRMIAVFGSAGLRDRAKRRMMAEISVKLADVTILTAEDPRTESLDSILEEMAEGARSQGGVEMVNFWRIPDRVGAIRKAIELAQPGDLVIACGKGHEQSMCFGETEYAWDDRTAMRAALSELYDVAGWKMPFLPTQNL